MKNILFSQKDELDRFCQAEYIPRENLSESKKSLENNLIKVIIGPRRAGKSVFCLQLLQGRDFAYINFDDERLVGISDYDRLIDAAKSVYGDFRFLLLDEIQNLSKWELLANRLHRQGVNLILTGSNSRLLSSELSTHLTGRYLEFAVFPFSFREYLRAKLKDFSFEKMSSVSEAEILPLFSQYMQYGGYPETVVTHIDISNYLKLLVESVIFKDVVRRHRVRHSKLLFNLAVFLMTNHSSEITFNSLVKSLDFSSIHTAQKYVGYLQEAFLVFMLHRHLDKVKTVFRSPRKIYGVDNGALKSFSHRLTPDTGRLLENLVAIELLRKGKNFNYYRDENNNEIDFVIKAGHQSESLIQVCYSMENPRTREREYRALARGSRNLNCQSLMVLTQNEEGEDFYKGERIQLMPVWKWLLSSV